MCLKWINFFRSKVKKFIDIRQIGCCKQLFAEIVVTINSDLSMNVSASRNTFLQYLELIQHLVKVQLCCKQFLSPGNSVAPNTYSYLPISIFLKILIISLYGNYFCLQKVNLLCCCSKHVFDLEQVRVFYCISKKFSKFLIPCNLQMQLLQVLQALKI